MRVFYAENNDTIRTHGPYLLFRSKYHLKRNVVCVILMFIHLKHHLIIYLLL